MSRLTSELRGVLSRSTGDRLRHSLGRLDRDRDEGLPLGWIIAGAAVIGLGILTWSHLGPDLKRYMKIRSM